MKQIVLLMSMTALLAGCMVMVPGHLYPVKGPLAAQTPMPIFPVTLNGVMESGTLSITLQNGEVCRGNWSAVRQDDPLASSMSADWDSVYGQGFFTANVLGNPVFARANLTGTQGTILAVQMYDPTPGQITSVVGVARDNNGNVFKLTF